jgi:enamine deaminase RidA (YjgF/YER057c/UK114 family)
MGKRTVHEFEFYKIYSTLLGGNQIYISAAITDNAVDAAISTEKVYYEILAQLKTGGFEIVHERIFASLEYRETILSARGQAFITHGLSADTPLTFIQGHPIKARGLAGIQIRAFKPTQESDKVWTIFEDGKPVGRGWSRNGAQFSMLQDIYGDPSQADRYHEAGDMFDRAQRILEQDGLGFENVLRTWIYLSKILDWYGEFNRARNARFTEYGILGHSEKENTEAEQIYMPASTGILGENPHNAAGTMDVLAVSPDSENISLAHTTGVQQMSPYRYGSAFSRAMTLKENDVTHILLSGTASIDEHGKTVFLDDTKKQIRKTFEVVEALIEKEGATLQDINEATVFLKSDDDIELYWQTAEKFGVTDLPAIFIVADVCRADLLFEIDAAIAW